MEIKVEISDERFNELFMNIEKPIFTDDELKEIMKDAIKSFVSNSDLIKNMFVEPGIGYRGGRPTPMMEKIVSNIDINEDVKELKEAVVSAIKNNMADLLTRVYLSGLTKELSTSLMQSPEVQMKIMETVHDEFERRSR